jgi:hypothetical protein
MRDNERVSREEEDPSEIAFHGDEHHGFAQSQ